MLALCRQLIAAGHDPRLPLEAWRGLVPCLRVRSIGEAAQLRLATHGSGVERLSECTAASPVEETPVRLCPAPGRPKRTSEAAVPRAALITVGKVTASNAKKHVLNRHGLADIQDGTRTSRESVSGQ